MIVSNKRVHFSLAPMALKCILKQKILIITIKLEDVNCCVIVFNCEMHSLLLHTLLYSVDEQKINKELSGYKTKRLGTIYKLLH